MTQSDITFKIETSNNKSVYDAMQDWIEIINSDTKERKREEIERARDSKIDDILE